MSRKSTEGNKPRVSCIICTLGRRKALSICLQSIKAQGIEDIQIVVVEQGYGHSVRDLCNEIGAIYVWVPEPGLSRARNVGLKHCSGDLFLFPDDDCMLDQDFVKNILTCIDRHPECAIFIGQLIDSETGNIIMPKCNAEGSREISWYEVLDYGISCTLAVRSMVFERIGGFDEQLGLGSHWASGEESDLLFRALSAGFRLCYCPKAIVYHPVTHPGEDLERPYLYGLGSGAMFAKQILVLRQLHLIPLYFRYMTWALIASLYYWAQRDCRKSRWYWRSFTGQWRGFYEFIRTLQKQ